MDRFREMIGREYRLKVDFDVLGVKRNLRSKDPDYYIMLPASGPGIGGPELVEIGTIAAGTRIRIIGAVDQTAYVFHDETYLVELTGTYPEGFLKRAIRLRDTQQHRLFQSPRDRDEAPQLSEMYFESILKSESQNAQQVAAGNPSGCALGSPAL